jgi:hypothetical protein
VVRGEKVFEVYPDSASRPLRLVLRPGSLMILPPGLKHGVTTTQWSVVVAGNFVPRHCWQRVCRALKDNDLADCVRARELEPGTFVLNACGVVFDTTLVSDVGARILQTTFCMWNELCALNRGGDLLAHFADPQGGLRVAVAGRESSVTDAPVAQKEHV